MSLRNVSCAAALWLGVAMGAAGAAVFDFSADEFPELGAEPSPADRIGLSTLAQGGVRFGLTAFEGQATRPMTLFVPAEDVPGSDPSRDDDDLVPLGIDSSPRLRAGRLDPVPLFDGHSANSLVVQTDDPRVPAGEPNDLAPSGGAVGRLVFTLESARPVWIERLSFVDDVDAEVTGPSGEVFGRISIDGDPACTMSGDGCVAGLLFEGLKLSPGESFAVSFDGSGGVLGFETADVPVPAAAPMLLAALGLMGYAARRSRRDR